MASVLDQAQFKNEAAAYKWVEARVWPDGRVCPHCGVVGDSGALKGKSTRIGVYKCYGCRKPFTVKVGTIFESSHIKLHIWLQAMFLLASSKKGISSNQLSRTLGVTLKSAWFMSHRIREAMRAGPLLPPMGGGGGAVEVDETFFGQAAEPTGVKGIHKMNKVLSLLDRQSGEARSFIIKELKASEIFPILRANIANEAAVFTDEAVQYKFLRYAFPAHASVNHKLEEWARGSVSTNVAEGFFSVFKRGMRGTYQHCKSAHLHRYTAEFDFRHSNRAKLGVDDQARFAKIVAGVKGKRLTYQTARRQVEATAPA